MLSRIADSLFWMNRYVERAEGMLRMLKINYATSLDRSETTHYDWYAVLDIFTYLSDEEKNKIKEKLTHKIEMLTTVLFLPLFFVVTGLRTKVNLLNSPELIGLFVIVLLLAFGGKIIGTAIPARMTGKTWYQSWSIGVLMNTRGLMELIVLNLGYDLGILPESLFTILTLVAIISTVLTSPLLDLINRWYGVKEDNV